MVKEKPAESASNTEEVNQAFLEPDTEGEKKIANKVDAYKREQEEAARKKRELEKSQVKGETISILKYRHPKTNTTRK